MPKPLPSTVVLAVIIVVMVVVILAIVVDVAHERCHCLLAAMESTDLYAQDWTLRQIGAEPTAIP